MRYSDHEQRQLDIASGQELDRAERRALAKRIDDAIMAVAFPPAPPPTTLNAPEPKRCPDCGPFFPCSKHMVC
jgi:hypothetical protein